MEYKFLTERGGNTFYPVTVEKINEAEEALGIVFPQDLKDFYLEVGYGFIEGSENNINRIMGPYSVRDFRLRQNDFEFQPNIDIYNGFEEGRLYFYEVNESAFMSMGFGEDKYNAIYYYDVQIASSLKEFLQKMQDNDEYYHALVDAAWGIGPEDI